MIESIQNVEVLKIKSSGSHQNHAYEELGLSPDTPVKEAYEKYCAFCTEFFKEPIDGIIVDGFISKKSRTLIKYNKKRKLFGTLNANGSIGSVYTADDEYWRLKKLLLHPETNISEAERKILSEKLIERSKRIKRRRK